jgi:hypothetical protein
MYGAEPLAREAPVRATGAGGWASIRAMKPRISAWFALVASPLVTGCATTYVPRPSPRVQVVAEGSSLALVKDGRSYPFNRFGGGLEDAVQGNPQAEAEARSFRDKTISGFVLSTVGAVAAGVGAGVLVGNEVQANPSTTIQTISITSIIGGLVLSIVGGAIAGSAQPHLWNAINIYNDSLPPYPGWAPQQRPYPGYPAPAYAPPAYPPPAYAPPPTYAPQPAPAPVPVPAPAPVPPPR